MRPPIFNLSFNKCATTTLHQFFLKNGISSRSHGGNRRASNLTLKFFQNFALSEHPLKNLEDFEAFSDLNYVQEDLVLEANVLFKYFHEKIPEAYFIFVDRDLESWIESRIRHGQGSFALRYMKNLGVDSEKEIIRIWKEQYVKTSRDIASYFSSNSSNFLWYNLAKDSPSRICDFLSPTYSLDVKHWNPENVKKIKSKSGEN